MSQQTPQEPVSKKKVVYTLSGTEKVAVRRESYRTTDGGALEMDLYYPPDAQQGTPLPAAVIVAGFPDLGYRKILGCKFKEMGSTLSWARLLAASGMVAIAYENREPVRDIHALLQQVRENADALDIDARRIGIWASSGNVPLAISVLMGEPIRCAALCYGFTLDLQGSTTVAEASKNWGFVNPASGKSIEAIPRDVPMFLARAGKDQFAGLNDSFDRFVLEALHANLPLSIVNHSSGPHSFDLFDDSEITREIVRQILAFLRFHLSAETR
jgi:hypothetical protein